MQSITTRLLLALGSGALSWYAYLKIAEYFGREDGLFIATALIVSVLVHELGHMLAFMRHGVATYMFFIVVLGGVGPLDTKKAEQLHDNAQMEVAIAGVLGNIVVGLGALLLVPFELLTMTDAIRIVNLNAGLIAFNLVPIWGLDGAKIAKTLFDAIDETSDERYVYAMSAVLLVTATTTMVIGQGQFMLTALFIFGLRKHAREDDHRGHLKPGALSVREQCLWARAFMVTAAIGLIATALTPSWL